MMRLHFAKRKKIYLKVTFCVSGWWCPPPGMASYHCLSHRLKKKEGLCSVMLAGKNNPMDYVSECAIVYTRHCQISGWLFHQQQE